MKQVKVGVIGTGSMGQRHCRIYSGLRRVDFVGICDISPERGYQIAQQHEVSLYDRLDDLLEKVDAVSICVPTPFHFELAMRCLDQGVHVLIEKPITETLAQAEQVTQVARDSGLVVQVGHIERFNPTFLELKNVVENMTVAAINLRRLSAYAGSNTDVDAVLDLMIHDLDLALDLVGQEPVSISAYGLTAFSGTIDHAVAHFKYEQGPLVTVTASRVTEQKIRTIEVTALEAYLEADLLKKTILAHRRTIGEYLHNKSQRGVKYRQESVVESIHVPMFEPLFLELQHFVDCILENKSPLVTAQDGLKALRLATVIRNTIFDQLININDVGGAEAIQTDQMVEPALAIHS